MKKSKLISIIREEIKASMVETIGMETPYYGGSVEQMPKNEVRIKHFSNKEQWETYARQIGCTILDRGDDWLAITPNKQKIGTFSKMNNFGTLTI